LALYRSSVSLQTQSKMKGYECVLFPERLLSREFPSDSPARVSPVPLIHDALPQGGSLRESHKYSFLLPSFRFGKACTTNKSLGDFEGLVAPAWFSFCDPLTRLTGTPSSNSAPHTPGLEGLSDCVRGKIKICPLCRASFNLQFFSIVLVLHVASRSCSLPQRIPYHALFAGSSVSPVRPSSFPRSSIGKSLADIVITKVPRLYVGIRSPLL